jgi:DNA-binding GntR family transcriptional regulator
MSDKKIYKITFYKERLTSNNRSGDLSDKVFVKAAWFKSEDFSSYTKKQKKQFIKNILENTPRHEIPDKFTLNKKEQVLVNEKPRYSLSEAVFNEEISIPSHLVDNKKASTGVKRSW